MPPIMMASGAMPAMTVSGAAAATTKNTIELTPSAPCWRRSGAGVGWDTGLAPKRDGNRGWAGGSVGAGSGEPGAQHGQVAQLGGRGGGRVGGEMDQVGAQAGAQHAPMAFLERLVGDTGGVGGQRVGGTDPLA